MKYAISTLGNNQVAEIPNNVGDWIILSTFILLLLVGLLFVSLCFWATRDALRFGVTRDNEIPVRDEGIILPPKTSSPTGGDRE